jgi:DNA-binding response OmpR family regulator
MAKRDDRAAREQHKHYLTCGDLVVDLEAREVIKAAGQPQPLTPKECRLLEVFIRNRGDILSRKYLMRHVWETEYDGDTRTIEVHVSWLRHKIEDDPAHPRYLHTVRGVGYWFEPVSE